MRARVLIGVLAVLTTGALLGTARRASTDHVAEAGFWFDGVTFDAPALAAHGGPLTHDEAERVRVVALEELRAAFAGLRLDVIQARRAHYRVRVVQAFGPRKGIGMMAAAESRVFGPFGGEGAISFETVAGLAVDLAPAGTSRAERVNGIGRGLGRIAAHELAHQILPGHPLDAATDPSSYDYGGANHQSQFYGPARWDRAGPLLRDTLGLR